MIFTTTDATLDENFAKPRPRLSCDEALRKE